MKTSSIRSLITLPIAFGIALHVAGCGTGPLPDEEEAAASPDAVISRAAVSSGADLTTTSKAAATSVKTTTVTGATTTAVTPTVTPATATASATSDLQTLHPWDVRITGTGGLDCRGILIHPSWVLTAAHCIGSIAGTVSYARTDPTTGAVSSDSRSFDVNGPKRGMFVNPGYVADGNFGQPQNDIALIRLATPFNLDRNIQTVGLPRDPANPGRTGTMATNKHVTLPAGYTAVVRAPQLGSADCTVPNGFLCIEPPAGSLCEGDSGSGFTEVLNGRATVVGIASNVSNVDPNSGCMQQGGQAELTDVYSYRGWILSTMGMSLEQVEGRVRLRATGGGNGGTLRLTCISTTNTTIEVGMNVPGGEIAMDCDDVSVVCQAPSAENLIGFSLFTTAADGSTSTQSLPYLPAFTATYADPGTSFLRYTCAASGLSTSVTGNVLATATTSLAD
jgi:secreted trypsin-like serine protease